MIKQVIVVRKDLNMRKGKCVAQGAHASLLAFEAMFNQFNIRTEWQNTGQTKIVLCVNNEKQLFDLHNKAIKHGLISRIVVDAGITEFKGVPTPTAIAIGPFHEEEIDKVTGDLELL